MTLRGGLVLVLVVLIVALWLIATAAEAADIGATVVLRDPIAGEPSLTAHAVILPIRLPLPGDANVTTVWVEVGAGLRLLLKQVGFNEYARVFRGILGDERSQVGIAAEDERGDIMFRSLACVRETAHRVVCRGGGLSP